FAYEGPPHASFGSMPDLSDRTVMINGFSKSYSMTGWRLGYMIVPAPRVAVVEVVKSTLTICAPAVSQAAGLAGPYGAAALHRRSSPDLCRPPADRARRLRAARPGRPVVAGGAVCLRRHRLDGAECLRFLRPHADGGERADLSGNRLRWRRRL